MELVNNNAPPPLITDLIKGFFDNDLLVSSVLFQSLLLTWPEEELGPLIPWRGPLRDPLEIRVSGSHVVIAGFRCDNTYPLATRLAKDERRDRCLTGLRGGSGKPVFPLSPLQLIEPLGERFMVIHGSPVHRVRVVHFADESLYVRLRVAMRPASRLLWLLTLLYLCDDRKSDVSVGHDEG